MLSDNELINNIQVLRNKVARLAEKSGTVATEIEQTNDKTEQRLLEAEVERLRDIIDHRHIESLAKDNNYDIYSQRFITGKLYDEQTFYLDLINNYDNFLLNRLPMILREHKCKINDGFGSYVYIDNLSYDPPSTEVLDNTRIMGGQPARVTVAMYPKEARDKKISYAIRIRGDFVYVDGQTGQSQRLNNYIIGEIPCMLGSQYCHLRNMSAEDKLRIGECPYDPLGYFVVKGNEYYLNIQSNLSYNLPILYLDKEERAVLRTTALTASGTFVNDVVLSDTFAIEVQTVIGGVKISMNPFQVMHLLWDPTFLGEFSVDAMLSLVISITKPESRYKIRSKIENTMSEYLQINDIFNDIVNRRNETLSKSKRYGANKDVTPEMIMEDLNKLLFAHINPISTSDWSSPEFAGFINALKIQYLAYKMSLYALFLVGDEIPDDRNHWAIRQVSNVGIMFERLFLRILRNIYSRFDGSMDGKMKSLADFKSDYKYSEVLDKFENSFTTNIWVVSSNQRAAFEDKNVVMPKEPGIVAQYASIGRINIPSSSKGGQIKVRGIHTSQTRFVCIWETPENERAGLIMVKGSSAIISKQIDDMDIITWLMLPVEEGGYGIIYYYNPEVYANRTAPCLVNGKFIGYCDLYELRDWVRIRKRGWLFDPETCVAIRHGALIISTMGGRLLCPTLVVGDGRTTWHGHQTVAGELVLDTLIEQGVVTQDTPYYDIVKYGAIEYIDPMEQDQSDVILAQSKDEFKLHNDTKKRIIKRLNANIYNNIEDRRRDEIALQELEDKRYTYCEITPNSIIGIASSIIPVPSTNQPGRNVYQAAMGKQAQGIYHSNACFRLDREAKMLTYPDRPIFSTEISSRLGLDEMPSGESVIVAVYMDPDTPEDAIKVRRSAVERGLFNSYVYKTHRVEVVMNSEIGDVLTNEPDPEKKKLNPRIYSNLDYNGLPKVGSYMGEGYCIIGISHHEVGKKYPKDRSIYVTQDEVGIVDKIFLHQTSPTSLSVAIKIRTIRIPQPGDKFASRHAQKGTLTKLENDEDMPFGRRLQPTLSFNSHGFPSRMTIGMMIEMVVGKLGALQGRNFDASAFNGLDINAFARALHAYGYSRKGTDTLMRGTTGEMMGYYRVIEEGNDKRAEFVPCQVFMGPCYYQRLRQETVEKAHARGLEGDIDISTRLPKGGGEEGAIRFGEMESHTLNAYGVASTLRERLVTLADDYTFVACTACGTEAKYIKERGQYKFHCNVCGSQTFGKCQIPYGLLIIRNMLAGLNINFKFKLEKVPEVQKHKR